MKTEVTKSSLPAKQLALVTVLRADGWHLAEWDKDRGYFLEIGNNGYKTNQIFRPNTVMQWFYCTSDPESTICNYTKAVHDVNSADESDFADSAYLKWAAEVAPGR